MNRKNAVFLAAAIVLAVAGYMVAQQSSVPSISVHEAKEMMDDSDVVLLDVRTVPEHIAARIKESPLIPVQELEQRIQELESYKGKKIIVYCRTANRSSHATAVLRKNGFDAYNMSGGIVEWKSEQLPTISGAVQ